MSFLNFQSFFCQLGLIFDILILSSKVTEGNTQTKQFHPKETLIYIRLVKWAMEALDVYTLSLSPTAIARSQPHQTVRHVILP